MRTGEGTVSSASYSFCLTGYLKFLLQKSQQKLSWRGTAFSGPYLPHTELHLHVGFFIYLLVLLHTSCMQDFLLQFCIEFLGWSQQTLEFTCASIKYVHLQLNYFISYASSCFAVSAFTQSHFLLFLAIKHTSSCLLDCHPYPTHLLFGFTFQTSSCNNLWHFCL